MKSLTIFFVILISANSFSNVLSLMNQNNTKIIENKNDKNDESLVCHSNGILLGKIKVAESCTQVFRTKCKNMLTKKEKNDFVIKFKKSQMKNKKEKIALKKLIMKKLKKIEIDSKIKKLAKKLIVLNKNPTLNASKINKLSDKISKAFKKKDKIVSNLNLNNKLANKKKPINKTKGNYCVRGITWNLSYCCSYQFKEDAREMADSLPNKKTRNFLLEQGKQAELHDLIRI